MKHAVKAEAWLAVSEMVRQTNDFKEWEALDTLLLGKQIYLVFFLVPHIHSPESMNDLVDFCEEYLLLSQISSDRLAVALLLEKLIQFHVAISDPIFLGGFSSAYPPIVARARKVLSHAVANGIPEANFVFTRLSVDPIDDFWDEDGDN